MKYLCTLVLLAVVVGSYAQAVNPVIKSAGAIHDIPYATVKPDPSLDYNIVIDVATGPDKPSEVNPSLDNVARLINLHVVGGVPKEKLHIVLAIHNVSAFAVLSNEAYRAKYKTDNPNLRLLEELAQAGVRLTVCGQSLIKREIDPTKLAPNVEVATSMLTTVTTHQLKGYAVLKF